MFYSLLSGNNSWKFHNDTMTGTWWKRCNRRTDGQMDRSVLRAAWQLKMFTGFHRTTIAAEALVHFLRRKIELPDQHDMLYCIMPIKQCKRNCCFFRFCWYFCTRIVSSQHITCHGLTICMHPVCYFIFWKPMFEQHLVCKYVFTLFQLMFVDICIKLYQIPTLYSLFL